VRPDLGPGDVADEVDEAEQAGEPDRDEEGRRALPGAERLETGADSGGPLL
jgi:hypothetical protein